jgi:hypothetical protein
LFCRDNFFIKFPSAGLKYLLFNNKYIDLNTCINPVSLASFLFHTHYFQVDFTSSTFPLFPGLPGSPFAPAEPGAPGRPSLPGFPGTPGIPGIPAEAQLPEKAGKNNSKLFRIEYNQYHTRHCFIIRNKAHIVAQSYC